MASAELMRLFGFWSAILALKVLIMSLLTARQRFRKKVFANHDDAMMLPKARVTYDDQDVERVRRSHLNDLENVVPWITITALWLQTNPSVLIGGILIRAFVMSRICHTLFYAIYSKQPFRAIAFFAGWAITAYECGATIYHYL